MALCVMKLIILSKKDGTRVKSDRIKTSRTKDEYFKTDKEGVAIIPFDDNGVSKITVYVNGNHVGEFSCSKYLSDPKKPAETCVVQY